LKRLLTLISLVLISNLLFSQNKLRFNLNEDGSNYIQGSLRTQVWARYTDLNPGTTLNGFSEDQLFDISIRRIRINSYGQVNKVFFYFGVGNNNLNQNTFSTFRLKLLDAYMEYRFSEYLHIGAGKSAWQGLSRMNLRSTATSLSMDAPIFTISTVNRLDDLGRNLGIWAKGQFNRIDYRVAINNTARINVGEISSEPNFTGTNPGLRYSFYTKYMFFDKESNSTPFSKGTYLGNKKILNIGVGSMYQSKIMSSLNDENDTIFHDLKSFAADIFVEIPLNSKSKEAVTGYFGYFNTDLGTNYLRNVGANNPANGINEDQSSVNGIGNAFPMIGTGTTLFAQFAYLTSKNVLENFGVRIQPYYSVQYSNYEKYSEAAIIQDLGLNIYFSDGYQKVSLNVQRRPIFKLKNEGFISDECRMMAVFQYQVTIK